MILPAHHIWDHDETLKNTASTVVRPPKGWKEMLFDRKKLTWEHAAMTLEPATNSLFNINCSGLLGKYMLALSGTSEDDQHSEYWIMKSQYYSYEYLRLIVNDKFITEDDQQSSKLRNKTTNYIILHINLYNVKMRPTG